MDTTITTAPATAQGQHRWLPLKDLRASPLNHRKTFPKDKMAELAESIRSKGVIQPIIARPLDVGFEVVAGERRFRAAKDAGLTEIPAIVRTLTDVEVLELQVIENGQREDPHPLEEAEGYEALLKCQHANGDRYTADEIAAKVGKSRSYVFGRLKLCALCPEGRKAFYASELDASRALLIARIGHHDTQRQALKEISGDRWNGPMSYREAHQHVVNNFMLQLENAVFDIKDADLVAKAGACAPCPKRTGNQVDLFGDVKSADVCTDPKCFSDKRLAHHAKAALELEAKGKKVIYGEAARKAFPEWDSSNGWRREEMSDRYVPMSGHLYVGNRHREVREILGPEFEPTIVQHPTTGKLFEVATRQAVDAAAKAGKSAKAKVSSKAPKASAPKGPDVDEMLTERLAQLIHKKAPKEFGKAWLLALAGEFVEHLSTRDLEAVALAWGWKANAFRSGKYSAKKLPAEASKLGERDLVLLMFHVVFAIGAYSRAPVLKLFGIKEPEIREQILEERKAAAKKAREAAKGAAEAKAAAKNGLGAKGIAQVAKAKLKPVITPLLKRKAAKK